MQKFIHVHGYCLTKSETSLQSVRSIHTCHDHPYAAWLLWRFFRLTPSPWRWELSRQTYVGDIIYCSFCGSKHDQPHKVKNILYLFAMTMTSHKCFVLLKSSQNLKSHTFLGVKIPLTSQLTFHIQNPQSSSQLTPYPTLSTFLSIHWIITPTSQWWIGLRRLREKIYRIFMIFPDFSH